MGIKTKMAVIGALALTSFETITSSAEIAKVHESLGPAQPAAVKLAEAFTPARNIVQGFLKRQEDCNEVSASLRTQGKEISQGNTCVVPDVNGGQISDNLEKRKELINSASGL
jgi:hypothetical protein